GSVSCTSFSLILYNGPATSEIYTLSLHELFRSPERWSEFLATNTNAFSTNSRIQPTSTVSVPTHTSPSRSRMTRFASTRFTSARSEEHTSELQSRENLVCRLLLEKKKNKRNAQS